MNKEQALKILENIPEDIYTLDGISPTETESWSLRRLYKTFMYRNNDQSTDIECIIDWAEETFNVVHVKHNSQQELPSIYNKIGEKFIAYFSIFGLKRNFYL